MKPIRAPFGVLSRGPAVIWPEFTGPSIMTRRHARQPEVWERHADQEAFTGEFVFADLTADTGCDDMLLVLARYLTVRVAWHACQGAEPGLDTSLDREAAGQYLEAMQGHTQERRWLRSVLASVDEPGGPGRDTISRMNAAANAASKYGHVNGAHSLHAAAWAIATSSGWHAEAGRVARSIAAAAGRGGGRRSQRLWSRRARVLRGREAS